MYGTFTLTPPILAQIINNLSNPTQQDIRNDGPCAALPVHWVAFNLKCADNKIQLNWITDNEINNRHFIVQRSNNGISWTDLDVIPAAGNNGGTTKYSYIDNQTIDNAYYRLAQVDLDGSKHYSVVIRAACAAPIGYKLWPNPAADKFLIGIQSTNSSTGIVKIIDSKGSIVKSQNLLLLPGQNQFEINVSHIPAGIYFVHMIWDGNKQQQRTVLVKK